MPSHPTSISFSYEGLSMEHTSSSSYYSVQSNYTNTDINTGSSGGTCCQAFARSCASILSTLCCIKSVTAVDPNGTQTTIDDRKSSTVSANSSTPLPVNQNTTSSSSSSHVSTDSQNSMLSQFTHDQMLYQQNAINSLLSSEWGFTKTNHEYPEGGEGYIDQYSDPNGQLFAVKIRNEPPLIESELRGSACGFLLNDTEGVIKTKAIIIQKIFEKPIVITSHDELTPYLNKEYYIMAEVSEHLEGLDMLEHLNLRSISPKDYLSIVQQLELILHKIADKGIMHRDFRPANIVVSFDQSTKSCKPTIIDLGFCIYADDATTIRGVTLSLSPEHFITYHHGIPYSNNTDTWALAVTILILLSLDASPSLDMFCNLNSHISSDGMAAQFTNQRYGAKAVIEMSDQEKKDLLTAQSKRAGTYNEIPPHDFDELAKLFCSYTTVSDEVKKNFLTAHSQLQSPPSTSVYV